MYIVELTLAAYKALGDHLPQHTLLVPVWRNAIVISDGEGEPIGMKLSCDETQIEAMLSIAHLHHPASINAIQQALDRLRP